MTTGKNWIPISYSKRALIRKNILIMFFLKHNWELKKLTILAFTIDFIMKFQKLFKFNVLFINFMGTDTETFMVL